MAQRPHDGHPRVKTSVGAWRDKEKGVLQGNTFRFETVAPRLDCLTRPVMLRVLPKERFPQEALGNRLRRFWGRKAPARQTRDERILWRYHALIDEILGLLWADFSPSPPEKGVVHPYQLKAAFALLAELPETLAQERRYLDDVLSMILNLYKEAISQRPSGALTFWKEAQEYFYSGYRMEKLIVGLPELDEAFAARQHIFDNYYHGIRYYIYSLLSREELDPDNQIFMFFGNALYFTARIDWNGQLLARPASKALPSRQWVLFYALRDRTVLKQYQKNPDYAGQLRNLLRVFPEDAAAVAAAKAAIPNPPRGLRSLFARRRR